MSEGQECGVSATPWLRRQVFTDPQLGLQGARWPRWVFSMLGPLALPQEAHGYGWGWTRTWSRRGLWAGMSVRAL